MARKTFVAYGTSDDLAEAFGVSRSWLSNAANRGRKLKGLDVISIDGDMGLDVGADLLARVAVSALRPETRERLRGLLREAWDGR